MVSYSQAACSNTMLNPSRLAAAHTLAPVDTPNAIRSPEFLEFDIADCETTTKLGPGMITTRNQIPARLARASKKFIDSGNYVF